MKVVCILLPVALSAPLADPQIGLLCILYFTNYLSLC